MSAWAPCTAHVRVLWTDTASDNEGELGLFFLIKREMSVEG